ncbi:unconventional myosin-IXAa-like [Xenentodon cancila]
MPVHEDVPIKQRFLGMVNCHENFIPNLSERRVLLEALTTRKTVTVGEKLIVPYKLSEAGTVRDSMAKSLYSALFDWIVFRTNHALLNNKDLEDNSKILSIGVLDIFGFEDYENNSFEQFCINFANERLQHYFNQHIFKLEQEEYLAEGISWHNIDYIDNSSCLNLISKKPTALFHLLDEECNFPQASNQTLLDKFKRQHEGNGYIDFPAVMEPAFIIRHYAGKVKYGVKDFREKNTDHMRPDIVVLLKSSRRAFICSLMGIDPVATFRWAVLRAYFRAHVAFREAGHRHRNKTTGNNAAAVQCTVVKTADSFSFLHHPVHQRSLEILQRCKDEKHSITRKNPRTPFSDLQETNTLTDMSSWDGCSVGRNGRSSRLGRATSSGSSALEEDGIFLNSANSKLLERAQGILLRNKNCKMKLTLPKNLLNVKTLRYLSSVTLHDRITKSLLHLHKKKKPPSISAQFQASLNKLMETLDQSEPYFVKCIRSNAEKLPMRFSDSLVLRQLRYTGMLETVRIRQSGYSVKFTFQEFVHHFYVLLPRGTTPTKSGIREFFRRIHLPPAGYQVGSTKVFLREVERQRLQTLLHQEVLRRIVVLQCRFRVVLERKHFVNMRQAACSIQRWWRLCLLKPSISDISVEEAAAVVCLQTAWRAYRERRKFLQWLAAAVVLQRSWRKCCHRRSAAAMAIQTAWKGFRERRRYHRTIKTVTWLQAVTRGYLTRLRFQGLKDQHKSVCREPPVQLDLGTCEDLAPPEQDVDVNFEPCSESELVLLDSSEMVEDAERCTDELSHKNRSKRESRRMRELEQAQFSLDLLRVRTCSVGASPSEGVVSNSSTCQVVKQDGRGSPASHDRFELRSLEDMEMEGSGSSRLSAPQELNQSAEVLRDSNHNEKCVMDLQDRVEETRATFYIPSDQSPVHEPKPEKKKDSTSRRPVVVLISMQKESPVEEGELLAAQTFHRASQIVETGSQMAPITGLEVGSHMDQPCGTSAQEKREMFGVDESSATHETPDRPGFDSSAVQDVHQLQSSVPTVVPSKKEKTTSWPGQEAPSLVLDTKPPKAQKKSSTHTVTVNMVEKPSNSVFSPPRRKLPFSKSDKDLVNQERSLSLSMHRGESRPAGSRTRVVGWTRPKKKAQMSRTRSDFLTRCNSEGATQSDDDDDYYVPAHSCTLPPSLPQHSEMWSHKDQKKIQKTMSSGDLGKLEIQSKGSNQDRSRGKMRFWSKTKHSDKKLSREKSRSDGGEKHGPSSPHSPDLALSSRGVQDSRENRRRRSVKISGIALEHAQWQNDSLHILTSTHDYRSMNDFLMKKVSDSANSLMFMS